MTTDIDIVEFGQQNPEIVLEMLRHRAESADRLKSGDPVAVIDTVTLTLERVQAMLDPLVTSNRWPYSAQCEAIKFELDDLRTILVATAAYVSQKKRGNGNGETHPEP